MEKKQNRYYLKIINFIQKLHFFDEKFINYMENRTNFIRNSNDNENKYIITLKRDEINLVLPYPNNRTNFFVCLDGICEAYVFYLKKNKVNVDNNYLETLKASVKRVYIEENFKEDTIRFYNKEQLETLQKLDDEQIIGLALSFEISNGYIATGCFKIPDEYFFDADKAREYAEIELNYILYS